MVPICTGKIEIKSLGKILPVNKGVEECAEIL
jgi:hypothetical protein